jgi:hypothetical protein
MGLFLSGFQNKILYAFLISPMPRPSHLLWLMKSIYKLWSSSLRNFLQCPITSSLLCPKVLLRTLFSNALCVIVIRCWPVRRKPIIQLDQQENSNCLLIRKWPRAESSLMAGHLPGPVSNIRCSYTCRPLFVNLAICLYRGRQQWRLKLNRTETLPAILILSPHVCLSFRSGE